MSQDEQPAAVSTASLAAGTRWMVFSRLVTQASRFLVSILLARWLSPEAFGLIAVALTTILALDVLKDMGTGAAVIQRPQVDQTLLSSVWFVNAGIGAAAAAFMVFGAGWIAALFNTPDAEPVVQVLSVTMLLYGLSQTHHAVLRRTMRFDTVATAEVSTALVNAVISIGLALAGWGVWSMVWGNIAGTLVGACVVWFRTGWGPSWRFSLTALRGIAGFSLHTTAFNAVTYLLRNVDKVLVGRWLGAGPLGIYTLAQRTISYPLESVSNVLMTVLFPAFSRLQHDDRALRRGYTRAVGAIAFVTLPVMVGAAVVAEPLVDAVLGDHWAELVPLLWFMAPAGALGAMLSAVNTLYSAKGRADLMFRWGVASGVFTLAGFAVGLQWGLVGLAVAYLIVTVVQTPVGFWIALRLVDLPLRRLLRALVPYFVMTAVMALAAWAAVYGSDAAGASSWASLLLGIGAGGIVYLGLALLWRPPAFGDLMTLARRTSPADEDVEGDPDAR